MPYVVCLCGTAHSRSSLSLPDEQAYFPVARWDAVVARCAAAVAPGGIADAKLMEERISDVLAAEVQYFFTCTTCGRRVFYNEEQPQKRFYRPDPG